MKTRTIAKCHAEAVAAIWQSETFSAWRITSLAWQDAKPELIARADSLDEAIAAGANACQPKAFFYVLHTDEKRDPRRGRSVMKFYRVGQSGKGGFTRQAFDGPYAVPVKSRTAEHLFDMTRDCRAIINGDGE